MKTPQHCPGFENFRELDSFTCNCPECGEEIEIFSDEFDKTHNCPACGKSIDFTQCTLSGRGGKKNPGDRGGRGLGRGGGKGRRDGTGGGLGRGGGGKGGRHNK